MRDDRRGSIFRSMTRAEARFMLFWDSASPRIRNCFRTLDEAICQGEVYHWYGPDHVRDQVHQILVHDFKANKV